MSDEQRDNPGGTPAGNIFGKLPDSRPGTRSPRRRTTDAGKAKGGTAKAKAKPAKAPAAKPTSAKPGGSGAAARPQPPEGARPKPAGQGKASAGTDRGGADSPRAGRETDQRGPGGLEDIAWAGVAAAAEAATIGVRLASRAIDALRGSTERR